MGFYRVFSDPSGRSRIEPLDEAHPLLGGGEPDPSGLLLKRFPPGTFLPAHPAPRRMWTIILEGSLELAFPDGTVRRFGPGDVRLMEDTSGSGHTTRVVGDDEVVIAVIPLAAA